MSEDGIDCSAKLYMIQKIDSMDFYVDAERNLVPAFTLKSDAVVQLKRLQNMDNYRIIYAAPCEFLNTRDVLWNAFLVGET